MESISIFDIIKVGIGPSSSHTMGPWQAAIYFCNELKTLKLIEEVTSVEVNLFGSLAKTGKGHGTDFAVVLGLAGYDFRTINTDLVESYFKEMMRQGTIKLAGEKEVDFTYDCIKFEKQTTLDFHPNGLTFIAKSNDRNIIEKTYFSVGGGFVVEERQSHNNNARIPSKRPCHDGDAILTNCQELQIRVSDLVKMNESSWLSENEIDQRAVELWNEMLQSIWRGCQKQGVLPGFLKVKRRAGELFQKLTSQQSFSGIDEWLKWMDTQTFNFNLVNKWVSCFALAVNEENASYGRIITAPTNGAAGVIPAVLAYAYFFEDKKDTQDLIRFILTAGEIGTLFKKSATISAAMGGCQAEIGVSSAMAAAGLSEILGGSPAQVLMAAEIAMEHHLGLTCDPVGGLVQIPCIERNTMGAIKAITAKNIALESNPNDAKVSLDSVIKTMWQTALDMNSKYKETSEGGLAQNISVNIAEC